MVEKRRKFDVDFKAGAVRMVRETGKPIAQVARDLGVNEGTLGNWCALDRRHRGGGDGELSESERAELIRLRGENAELAMQRACSSARSPSGFEKRWASRDVTVHRLPEGQTTASRTRLLAGRWECPRRGCTSGGTAMRRRGTPAEWH
jgi:transposase